MRCFLTEITRNILCYCTETFYCCFLSRVARTNPIHIQTGLFLVFYDRGGRIPPPPALRNSENIKVIWARLGGQQERMKYVWKCLIWHPHHEVMTSDDVIIASSFLNGGYLGPPSWISGFFKNLKKTVQNRLKSNFKWSKDLKNILHALVFAGASFVLFLKVATKQSWWF